ncbi:MAG: c-type cytochrome biogenesis protein CcmI [Betaproteobacteria bacterium]
MSPAFDELVFWLIAAAMTVLALAFVVPDLIARRAPAAPGRRASVNAAIYRSHLAELERERDAGRLTDGQFAEAREEMERRLLGDADDDAPSLPGVAPRASTILLVIAVPAVALGLYTLFGEPGATDMTPRPGSALADTAPGTAPRRDDLARHLAHNARDGRGWVLLARMDFAADRFGDAAESYRKAIAVAPRIRSDAGVWCEYADALAMAQGGVLAGRPREHIMHALALDPAHPKALEMAGSAAYEQGEFASAASYWRTLLATLPERSARHRDLATAIARAVQFSVAAAASGDGIR